MSNAIPAEIAETSARAEPDRSGRTAEHAGQAELTQIESARGAAREAVARGKSEWRRRPAEETFNLGRYLITGRIASGGMATVYRARLDGEGGFAREFAIKVIHAHLAAAEGFKDRFLDEARVASRVNHPNVVATIDSDQDHGYHYLVLELVDGVTLRQLQVNDLHRSATSEGARLNPSEAARVVCDAARGLHAVHTVVDDEGQSLEVVHRDLSPHNLMLDITGRTVLIDLGLAKARGQLGHTQTGVLCGKLPYMSPEQSRIAPLDARSDVFSLGSVLFELAVGQPPFGDDHTPGTLDKLRKSDPDRLARLLVEAEVPSWLARVVLGCLRREPGARYQTAAALADALDDGMRDAGVIQSNVRQALSRRATAVAEQLGPLHPAEPLPPLISLDPTGSHRAVPQVGGFIGGLPGWVRGLGMATAGAVLVLLVLLAIESFDRRSARAGDQHWIPNLTAAVNATAARPEPIAAEHPDHPDQAASPGSDRGDSPAGSATAPLPLDTTAPPDEVVLEPVHKRKRPGANRDPLEEFKSNPYE
ncbi:Serine/threonine protein kinase [Enhygromyxa salina]|uniref:Serine/threonine protein kinase n=1 Tax=Enhygromyxa salina TaxID=215803 RepID=A0A0C2CV51_9BACT|nr:Serine/threonine protein kinase [Enhygromyxa salina]